MPTTRIFRESLRRTRPQEVQALTLEITKLPVVEVQQRLAACHHFHFGITRRVFKTPVDTFSDIWRLCPRAAGSHLRDQYLSESSFPDFIPPSPLLKEQPIPKLKNLGKLIERNKVTIQEALDQLEASDSP